MKKFLKNNRSGFTLIELLVVIAILAVLATLYVPRIISSTTDAKKTVAIANARTLASEITMYNAGHDVVFLGSVAVNTIEGFSDANKTKYSGCKQVVAADLTRGAGEGIIAAPAEIKELANGRAFPSPTYVIILTDAKGNCFIVAPNGDNL